MAITDQNNNAGTGFTSVDSWEALFSSTIYSGEYNVTSTYANYGDPRWYSE